MYVRYVAMYMKEMQHRINVLSVALLLKSSQSREAEKHGLLNM